MPSLDLGLLLRAYAIGIFPMSDSRDATEVYWVEPHRRAILPLDRFHLSRSLRKTIRSDRFIVTRDQAFADIVSRCADRPDTWINAQIEESYNGLHRGGHAHSIEVWSREEEGRKLVGGLYGVRLGGAFFGESMYSCRPDASKVALAWLVARLIVGRFSLLDCQFMTEHLESLGAIEIDQKAYLQLLSSALGSSAESGSASEVSGLGRAEGAVSPVVAEAPDFEALDRLLEGPSDSSSLPSGWVIAQLLGQTS